MTRSIKHSEGPWEVGDLDRNGQRIVRNKHIEICTCWHHCVGSIEKEMEQNAILIAAAPDMGALLVSAYQHISHGGPTRAELKMVLEKAGLLRGTF